MAGLIYPDRDELQRSHQPLTQGEWLVLDLLDSLLDDRWEIYPQPHLNGLRPDFVLLNPESGVAVYEVKDWDLKRMFYQVSRRADDTPYLQATPSRGNRFTYGESENPFTKIRAYREKLHELYMPSLGLQGTTTLQNITAGVIFTVAPTSEVRPLADPFTKPQESLEHFPVVGVDTLKARDIAAILPTISRADWGQQGTQACQDLRAWLREPYLSLVQNIPLELNAKQRELSEGPPPTGTRRRRLKGPAGSGKSLVLCDRAVRLAAEGKQVLVTGYNITLPHYLRDTAARAAVRQNLPRSIVNQITFLHYHGWNHSIEAEDQTYDAILIDEGSDIEPDWHQNLQDHLATNGEMLLVADASQDIYDNEKKWTDQAMTGAGYSGSWATLEDSYRCPDNLYPRLHDFVQFMKELGVDYPANLPTNAMQGRLGQAKLSWVNIDPQQDITDTCVQEILNTMSDLEPDTAMADMVFLADTHRTGHAVTTKLEEKDISVRHIFSSLPTSTERQKDSRPLKLAFWAGSPQVKACTIHSFRGWETRRLVVGFADKPLSEQEPERLSQLKYRAVIIYTAMTRLLRHENGSSLTVVCNDQVLAPYGESWKREPTSSPVANSA